MILVADANVIFSALISDGVTRKIILSNDIELCSPNFLIDELYGHINEITRKSGESLDSINELLKSFNIKLIEYDKYEDMLEYSKKICPDYNDSDYFALALKFNCPLWSNDKALKNQDKVTILNTKDLLEIL